MIVGPRKAWSGPGLQTCSHSVPIPACLEELEAAVDGFGLGLKIAFAPMLLEVPGFSLFGAHRGDRCHRERPRVE